MLETWSQVCTCTLDPRKHLHLNVSKPSASPKPFKGSLSDIHPATRSRRSAQLVIAAVGAVDGGRLDFVEETRGGGLGPYLPRNTPDTRNMPQNHFKDPYTV